MRIILCSVLIFSVTTGCILAQQRQTPQPIGLSGPYPTVPIRDDIAKGNRILAFDGFRFSAKETDFRQSQWSVAAAAGWIAAKGLAVGGRISYGRYTLRERGQSASSARIIPRTIYSFSPEGFFRYYATPYRVKPFLELSSGYNFQFADRKDTGPNMSGRIQSRNYVMSGALGLTFFVNRRVSLEMQYRHRFFNRSLMTDANERVNIRFGASWFIR
jgi:hypothetical protein